MTKHNDHVRSLALEFSYAYTSLEEEQWWRLFNALELADPALAAEIVAAWKRHKPCFFKWVQGNADDAEVDSKTCECKGQCDVVGAAARNEQTGGHGLSH